jgi:serine/threonine-protein kinase
VLGDITTPTKVALSDPQNLSGVTADFSHTCALQGASAYCWGVNGSGTVGNGTFVTPQSSPVAVTGGLMFASLESGSNVSCGLVQVGSMAPFAYDAYCWGSNTKDLLQTGGANVNVPTKVTTRQWDSFSVGVLHICAVDHATGLLNCWGDNGSEGSPAAGIGKLGYVPEGMIGTFGIGVVKTAVETHPAAH